jgi:Ca-activated chloride channel family protein
VTFGAPGLLVLLVLVPLAAAAHVLFERNRDRRAAAWASPALLPNMAERPPLLRRHLPFALALVGLALLLVGFARPMATHRVKVQEATVVVVLDVSGSMAATDASPSRILLAKALAERLIAGLPHGYRVAVETFSDHSAVVAPPGDDLPRIQRAIAAARSGPQGTALAEAVDHAVAVANTVPPGPQGRKPPALIVVFSDGGQTAGRVTPQQAAARAANAHVPVYTVALGTPSGVVQQKLQGGLQERIEVPVEPLVLQFLSRSTGGRYAAGAEDFDLKGIYDNLGSRNGYRHSPIEVTAVAAGGGIAFILAGAVLSGFWFRRLT